MSNKPYRPQAKTIKAVVEYLKAELGLSVYGQNVNLNSGEEYPSLMDYDADDIIKYRKLVENDELWSEGEF